MNLSHEKLSKLRRADEHFDAKYGAPGTESRTQFEAQAKAWYDMESTEQTNVSAVPSVLSVRATAPKFEPSI